MTIARPSLPRQMLVATVLLCTLAVTGCARWFAGSCAKPEDFASAVNNAPLQVPPGLSAPDTRAAMPIPKLDEPEPPREAVGACLDAPPRYAEPKPSRPAA